MFVKPIFKKNSAPALIRFFNELEQTLTSLSCNNLNLRYDTETASLGLADYRHVLTSMDDDKRLGSSARNAILEACFKAEHSAAGAGILTAIITVSQFKKLRKHQPHKKPGLPENVLEIFKHSRHATTQECFKIIKRFVKDTYVYEMLFEACHMAGGSGQLFLDHQGKNVSSISLQSGYHFPVGYTKEIAKTISTNSIELYDTDVLIIDGIIESVGEMHHILEGYSTSRKPIVVFARGFSEEVIATIVINKMRGALNLVPVQVPYDIDGVNMLNDIAVVCGSDIVSSLKGDLISSISLEEIPSIDKITINDHSTLLYAGSRSANVRVHVGELLKKRNESKLGDSQQIVDRRIQQLSPRAVHIKIGPEHGDLRGLLIDRVDTGLRMFKDISRDGIIDINRIEVHPCLSESMSYLKKFGITSIPSRAFHVGLVTGYQTAALLGNASVFLVDDNLHSE